MKEVCVCAAIQLEDGRIIRGHRHDDCIQTMMKWKKAGQDIGEHYRMAEQGFYTTHERFVSREEGMLLQRAANRPSACYGDLRGSLLFSEDLY